MDISKKINHGENVEYFIELLKEDEISEKSIEIMKERADEVYKNCIQSLDNGSSINGLILGKIQSGKTNNIMLSTAVAVDNNIRVFILFTTDSNWLYNQTISRISKSIVVLYIISKSEFDKEDLNLDDLLEQYEQIIIVSTKNNDQLSKLKRIIEASNIKQEKAFIFDDEADQASPNNKIAQEKQSSINLLLEEIKSLFDKYAYIQVTATPQALLLQNIESGLKPKFIVLTEPGPDYIGGDVLFEVPFEKNKYLKILEEENMDIKVFENKEDAIIPLGLKKAICVFLISATAKKIKKQGDYFSFMCHMSVNKDDHTYTKFLIESYFSIISMVLRNNIKISESEKIETFDLLKDAFVDIKETFDDIPPFEEIITTLKRFIANNSIQAINSDNEVNEPTYEKLFNIIIGGNKLSRGVTIKRLITTYYGRNTSSPKIDTMQQHARMYGYRKKDENVIRIFITKKLANRFFLINKSDNDLRELIAKHANNEGVIPINVYGELSATRSSVLNSGEIIAYKGGKEYFPNKVEYAKEVIEEKTKILDLMLSKYIGVGKSPATKITIDFIINVLNNILAKSSTGFWNNKRIISILEMLKNKDVTNEAYIVVRKDRKIKKNEYRGIGAVLSEKDHELAIKDKVTVFLYRFTGEKELGWDDQPFWVPVVKFPKENVAYLFNISEE